MHEDGKKLLNLMFRPGETVCVSHNLFSYHSVPLAMALDGTTVLIPKEETIEKLGIEAKEAVERIDSSQLILCAINPIKGFREDTNCTAFRNFLVEVDYGPLAQQLVYVQKLGMPYSAVIFSGNKSLHFLISLDVDIPDEKTYRKLAEWILACVPLADQNTFNPSRSIRIPGAWRTPKKRQMMVKDEFRGPVKLSELRAWLEKHPGAKPIESHTAKASGKFDYHRLKPWVRELLTNGLDPKKGRNKQWFSIACEFALAGYSEDATIDILSEFFTPERDFKEKEWRTAIKQGFKLADRK